MLVIGLDQAGKSTILNQLKPESKKDNDIQATVGFMVEKFQHGKVDFTMWDMSGSSKYRSLWEKYLREANAIIFVIDSSDTSRLGVVESELEMLLEHEDLKENPLPLLFFANKADRPESRTASEISKVCGLERIVDRPWTIQACCGLTGMGLPQGMSWLEEHLE